MPRIYVYTTSPFLRLARRYDIVDCQGNRIAEFQEFMTENAIVTRLVNFMPEELQLKLYGRTYRRGTYIPHTNLTFYIYCLDDGSLKILPFTEYRTNLQNRGWTMYYYTYHKCRNFKITLEPCHRDIRKTLVVDTIECELKHPRSEDVEGSITWNVYEDRLEREILFTNRVYILESKRYAKISRIEDNLGNQYDYVYLYFKGTLDYSGMNADVEIDYLIPHYFTISDFEDDILNECKQVEEISYCCYDTCETSMSCYDDKYSEEAKTKIKNALKQYAREHPSPRSKTSIFETALDYLLSAFKNREILFSLDEIVMLEAHITTPYGDYDYDLTEYLRDELQKNGWI